MTASRHFSIVISQNTICHYIPIGKYCITTKLSFAANIAVTAYSCRFILHSIRRIHPFLTQHSAQILVHALVILCLHYCDLLMAGLPACAIQPLQLIQNAAAWLVFNWLKFSHITPLFHTLHWLPMAAWIWFKTLVFAYRAVNGSGLSYMVKPYCPASPLRSATAGILMTPSLQGGPATTQQNHDRLLSPSTSGQQKLYTSSIPD